MSGIDKFLSNIKLKNKKKKNVLLIRLSSLGDVVLATAFVNALYSKYSDKVNIYFLTKKENEEILLRNCKIKKIFFLNENIKKTCDLIKSDLKIDFVIDISFTLKSLLIDLCLFKRFFVISKDLIRRRLFLILKNTFLKKFLNFESYTSIKKKYSNIFDDKIVYDTEIYLSETEILENKKMLGIRDFDICVGINTGASKNTKKWFLERYIALINKLLSCNIKIFLFGGRSDFDFNVNISRKINNINFSDLTGKIKKRDFFSIVSLMNVFFTTDSFGMHVSQALKIPVVSVFGPTIKNFGFWEPGKFDILLEDKDICCRPCSLHGSNFCNKNLKCMENVTVEKCYFAIKKLINIKDKNE